MKDFKARLDELDSVHGLTHQVVVAEAVDASTAVVSKIADVLASRLAPVSEVNTASSTEPTTAPTAGPSPDGTTTLHASTVPATQPPIPTVPAN